MVPLIQCFMEYDLDITGHWILQETVAMATGEVGCHVGVLLNQETEDQLLSLLST